MSSAASNELFRIFDARRVKAPELRNIDQFINGAVGWWKNHRPVLAKLREAAERVDKLEPEIQKLGATAFREAVNDSRDTARLGRLTGPAMDRALALAREASLRASTCGPSPARSWAHSP